LEIYTEPLPFVLEVWSPRTGEYDVETKLPEYRARGDREIWLLNPYGHDLVAWRRREDGTYERATYRGGKVQLFALPEVTIDLDALFAE
jgi:Uma2 family endonuclease